MFFFGCLNLLIIVVVGVFFMIFVVNFILGNVVGGLYLFFEFWDFLGFFLLSIGVIGCFIFKIIICVILEVFFFVIMLEILLLLMVLFGMGENFIFERCCGDGLLVDCLGDGVLFKGLWWVFGSGFESCFFMFKGEEMILFWRFFLSNCCNIGSGLDLWWILFFDVFSGVFCDVVVMRCGDDLLFCSFVDLKVEDWYRGMVDLIDFLKGVSGLGVVNRFFVCEILNDLCLRRIGLIVFFMGEDMWIICEGDLNFWEVLFFFVVFIENVWCL